MKVEKTKKSNCHVRKLRGKEEWTKQDEHEAMKYRR